MTTAAARLVALSGLSGVSAAAHLLAIGAGATAGAFLVSGSPLSSGSAAAHLLAERSVLPASLGAAPEGQRRKPSLHTEDDDEIDEAMPPAMVARLRDEMLSAALAGDVVARAKAAHCIKLRRREEEIALLLTL